MTPTVFSKLENALEACPPEMGSPDHNAPISDAPQQKVRETAAPPGTVPKGAERQKPYVYVKRKEVVRHEETVTPKRDVATGTADLACNRQPLLGRKLRKMQL